MFILQSSFAKSDKRLILAQKYFKTKQYTKSIYVLKKSYNFKKSRTIPASVYYLFGMNLFKLNRHSESIAYFNRMIKAGYLKSHIKTIKALKADEVDEDEVPKILKAVYFYMGQSYYALFLKSEKEIYSKNAKNYFRICDAVDFSDRCALFLENLSAKELYKQQSKYYYEFFLNAGLMYFQDSFSITNNTTSERIEILSNLTSICYGAGVRRTNAFRGYEFSGCAFSGSSTVQSQGGSKNYNQIGIPVSGILAEMGYFIKPDDNRTRLGLSIPLLYRSGQYQQPTGWTLEGAQQTYIGYMLNAAWEFSFLDLQMKFGKFGKNDLILLSTSINY